MWAQPAKKLLPLHLQRLCTNAECAWLILGGYLQDKNTKHNQCKQKYPDNDFCYNMMYDFRSTDNQEMMQK